MNTIQKNTRTKRINLRPVMIAAIAAALMASTAVAFFYLRPSQAARDMFAEPVIAEAFDQKGDVAVQTAKVKDYDIAFEGVVSGKGLSQNPGMKENGEIEDDRSYAVFAISGGNVSELIREHDASLTTLGIMVTPLVQGCAPWQVNAWTLSAGYIAQPADEVLYLLYDTESLEQFAGKEIYYAAYACEGMGMPSAKEFTMAEDGTITLNEGVDGAMFTVG